MKLMIFISEETSNPLQSGFNAIEESVSCCEKGAKVWKLNLHSSIHKVFEICSAIWNENVYRLFKAAGKIPVANKGSRDYLLIH